MARNYRKEYDDYHGKAPQKKARARRNAARRDAMAAGTVKKGDSREVHHSRPNARGKTRVTSRAENRRIGKP